MSSCTVGNDAARDAPKHTAAFILRAAIAAAVPTAGDCALVGSDSVMQEVRQGFFGLLPP